MFIQALLTIWLLALIFLTSKFRRENRINQQRLFSFFLILWSVLGIMYYDVWTYTSGELDRAGAEWQTYLPAAFFSICAGLGTYYFLQTIGKFREYAQKSQKNADAERAAKERKKQKKSGKKTK